ncbi:MAG TPA: lipid carrier--UDP-N-acetylgalactosaminyltransferase [Proteiniclasticum sp.]|nr:lipid carrier--UDP-N-acetylgalactosaminyltransferase [Proteiniclasticum sp.]
MKRVFDLIVSGVSIVLLFPLMGIIYCIIKIQDPGPAIFKQERIGKDGKLFSIYKFRSMKQNAPNIAAREINEEDYVTSIGKILRKTSLDELPQLLNILKGEMSFVGPRPLIPNEGIINDLRVEKEIHKLIPGLTGWAQIKARNTHSMEEKLDLDVYYYSNRNFLLDLKIIFMTFSSMIQREE